MENDKDTSGQTPSPLQPNKIFHNKTIYSIVITLISGILLVLATLYIEDAWEKEKVIYIHSISSPNLIEFPAEELEPDIYLSVFPEENKIIKSLFYYQIVLQNKSGQAIDDFTAAFRKPEGVILSNSVFVNSSQPDLVPAENKLEIDNTDDRYLRLTIKLLSDGGEMHFHLFGYAAEKISPKPIKANSIKKDWSQRTYEAVEQRLSEYKASLFGIEITKKRRKIFYLIILGATWAFLLHSSYLNNKIMKFNDKLIKKLTELRIEKT